MFRLGVLLLVVGGAVLVFTNPSQDAHKKVVYATTVQQTTNSETLGQMAVDMFGKLDLVPLQYNNYYVFSTTTLNGKLQSLGLFSHVWKWNGEVAGQTVAKP